MRLPLTQAERERRRQAVLSVFMLLFAFVVGAASARAYDANLALLAYQREAEAQHRAEYLQSIADSLLARCEDAAAASQSALEWLAVVQPDPQP